MPTRSQQRRAEACRAASPISTGADRGMPSVRPLQRKSVGLGRWVGREQGFGGSAGSAEPRGAGRHWEAVAKLREGPSAPAQSCGRPHTQPSGAHLHGYGTPTSPPPRLAKLPGQDTDSIPFLLFPFYSLSTQLCTPGSPGHSRPDPLPGAIAPQTRSPAPPNTLPSPLPRVKATYLGDLFPREGPHGGLASSIHVGGEAQLRAGERLQLCVPLPPLPLTRMLKGNHRPYLAMAILASGNTHRPPSRAARGRRRPSPASHHPILHGEPLGDGDFVAQMGWGQKKSGASSPCCYL